MVQHAIPAGLDSAAWRLRHAGDVQVLEATALADLGWLVHGFSTKPGGASYFNGLRVLNLGYTEWDSSHRVSQNRKLFQAALGAETLPLITLRQIHSDIVHAVARPPEHARRGDAHITRTPGLLLAVGTADCVPILLADTKQRSVAAIHAGWRGTLKRVAAKALGRMQMEFGTDPDDVMAVFGPAIGACCYEVGPEVAAAFAGQFPCAQEWFDGPFHQLASGEEPNPLPWLTKAPPGHTPAPPRVQLDLLAANRWQLAQAGVKPEKIVSSGLCTSCRTDLLFSYRREKPHTGRLLGVIGIRSG